MKKSFGFSLIIFLALSITAVSFALADPFISLTYSTNQPGQDNTINVTINNTNPTVSLIQLNITTFTLGFGYSSSSGSSNIGVYGGADTHGDIYLKNLSSSEVILSNASFGYYWFDVTNPNQGGTYFVNVSTLDSSGGTTFKSFPVTILGASSSVNSTNHSDSSTSNKNSSSEDNNVIRNVTDKTTIPHPIPLTNIGINKEDERTNQIKTSQYFSQEAMCRINFNIGLINKFVSEFPNASSSLQTSLNALQNDLSQVQSLGNASDIQDFVKGQYSNDVRNAISSVPTQEVSGISLSRRAALISSYNQLKSIYDLCEETNYINITNERLNAYQIQMNNFQNKTDALAAKGFDVTSLNQLLQDAQTQIIIPLQNTLANASSAQQVRDALKSYCLFDGCVNVSNFHLDAKFDIARLSIVLADLQNNSAALNLDNTLLLQAQQYLSDAQSILNSIGTTNYQNGQGQQIFSDIQKASKDIVQLMNQALHIIK